MLQLCQNIRQARLNKGLSQQKVADTLNEPRSTYKNWEENTEPELAKIRTIAEVLGVSFDELVSGIISPKSFQEQRRTNKLNHEKEEIPVYQLGTRNSLITVYDDDSQRNQIAIGSLNPAVFPGCNHAEKVTGDSMYPMIANQAIVVGDRNEEFRSIVSGERYVVHTKHGLRTCKYVHTIDKQPEKIKLVALSKSIPPQTVDLDDITLLMRVYYIINPA